MHYNSHDPLGLQLVRAVGDSACCGFFVNWKHWVATGVGMVVPAVNLLVLLVHMRRFYWFNFSVSVLDVY